MSDTKLETFLKLSVGDMIEAPSMMGSLTSEPTLFQVEAVTKKEVTFRVLFFEVRLGKAILSKTGEGLVWTYK